MSKQNSETAGHDTSTNSLSKRIVSFLFREVDGFPFKINELIKFLSAVVLVRNQAILDDFFHALTEKIKSSYEDTTLSNAKKELILYSSLCYIAFSNPKTDATINIKGKEYRMEKIPLTSGWFSSTYYAYGLKCEGEPSILVFKGTTFPTDGGFLVGLLADTRPHGAVGAQLYARGQEILEEWINNENLRTQKRVICTGQSLGGSMSLHCHINQPNKVDFFAINPPSLTSREKRVYNQQPKTHFENRTLKVLHHNKDFIFLAGSRYLPDNTVIIEHGKRQDSTFLAHALAPDCNQGSPEPEPKNYDNTIIRTVLNILWKIIKPALFLLVLVFHAIALPVRLITQISHKIAEHSKATPMSSASEPIGSSSTADILGRTAQDSLTSEQSSAAKPYCGGATSIFKNNGIFTDESPSNPLPINTSERTLA